MKSRYRKRKVNGKTVSEHRLVVEQHIGRPLLISEIIHHRNEDRYDNRIENLEVTSHQAHSEHHNQRHAREKICEVCGATFVPEATKRARKKTCSKACWERRRSESAASQMSSGPAPGARLSDEQVRAIRSRFDAGGVTMRALGREFGVHHRTVSAIVSRRAWQHVE